MIKKTALLLLSVCLALSTCLLFACGNKNEKVVTDIRIASFPDKVVYVIDVDNELDLRGGVLVVDYEKGPAGIYEMSERFYMGGCAISYDIDFEKEGIYLVTFSTDEVERSYPIQVISMANLKRLARVYE